MWTMDTLDPCSDDDRNNDVKTLYVEIIDRNRTYNKCTICGLKSSSKQRLETHVSCVHGKGEKWHKAHHNFKLSYGKKLGLCYSLPTILVLKFFLIRFSNKVNWRSHLKAVISRREQEPPLSCPHVKCLRSERMIHK